jgi:hypothetical protein
MVEQAMTWGVGGPKTHRALLETRTPDAAVPLDYLVDALNRAVTRKLATRTDNTEDRT